MSADSFLTHYNLIIDAQDAGERMRSFILKLAMRGVLAAQITDRSSP